MTKVEEGIECQLSQDVLPGQYRIIVWHPAVGIASLMPLIEVVAVVTGISPASSKL